MRSENWRILASNELSQVFASFFGGQHADIRPGEHGLEPREIAGEQSRFYDPEYGAFGQQRLGLPGRHDRHDNMRLVGREFEVLYRAEDDLFILELRLPSL